MTKPLYPHIDVKLAEQDVIAYTVISKTARAMRRAGVSKGEIDHYRAEAVSAWGHIQLLEITYEWVNVVSI